MSDVVNLREYVEALFDRDRAARETADAEREKAAQALADEREKAAQALALSLARQIEQGDEALRDHVEQQVEQIRAALAAVQREMELITQSSQTAIAKAEAATERRFESVNEFRANLADQTATFLPREVAEAQFQELRKQVQAVQEITSARAAARASSKETREGLSTTAGIVIAGGGLVLSALAILVTVMLAVNGVL